jgi:microcystin-dependent protein
LPISQNTALFSLLGTTYGGNGTSNFALPNLQGSAPMHAGQGPGLSLRDLGESGGEQTVTLLQTQMPAHNHTLSATTTTGTTATSTTNQLALAVAGADKQSAGNVVNYYSSNVNQATTGLAPTALSLTGGNLPHNNLMPFLGLTFIIALQGVYPPRS